MSVNYPACDFCGECVQCARMNVPEQYSPNLDALEQAVRRQVNEELATARDAAARHKENAYKQGDLAARRLERARRAERQRDHLAAELDELDELKDRVAELQGEGHLTVADVVAWLSKKAREFPTARHRQESAQDAIARLASKVSRGAIRPTEGGAR